MCLYSKTRIPKIATKDIEVYKTVIQDSDQLITLYQKYKVSKIMKTNLKECIKGILNIQYNKLFQSYGITSGFIHSYKNTYNARYIIYNLFICNSNIKYRLLKGIIPKGSIYYEDKTTYCSNKLILDL